MKINILNCIEIRFRSKHDPILPDGDVYVDRGDGGLYRWFLYLGDEYKGHCSRGFPTEHHAWRDAYLLMRDYRFHFGSPKP